MYMYIHVLKYNNNSTYFSRENLARSIFFQCSIVLRMQRDTIYDSFTNSCISLSKKTASITEIVNEICDVYGQGIIGKISPK